MKLQHAVLAIIIGAVTASPVPNDAVVGTKRFEVRRPDDNGAVLAATRLEARQSDESDELEDGSCQAVTFIFARGTSESGNMGSIVGPQTCTALKAALPGQVACQGVGSPYDATIQDNLLPQDTSTTDIGAATTLFDLANTKCPDTQIVAGGYSQGSAVMDGSIQALPAALMAKVKGVVLFGYTRNQQDGGRIPNYPTSETKVYCAEGDLVCNGTLIITAAHLSYGVDATNAATFLASKIS